ncbi:MULTISPECIES: flippase [unclassified Lebetimonas]|uniref:flippase n=1 Tax=unclassified Lebetimonas TaxID=2648158 RepID=UPI000463F563|nr:MULTISPECIES: flippase [unclassified Lebetimonas]
MIKKLKQKFQKEEHKRLLSNFISLAILQGANYILPLITFPYLVRVLGVEKFGLLAFAGATIAYFNILTDYGFNLTATREVSIYRDNKEKLNEIFSSVMIIKFILMIVSFLLLLILVYSFNKFRVHLEVFLLTFGMVIGQVLFPQWFFQGIERMKYITFLNILSKVIFTIAIFVFIHQESDYWKVPLINSLGFISAGLIALYIIQKDFNIKFRLQTLKTLKTYFTDGWHIFISNIAISLYTVSTTFILGLFTNNMIVGYYSIADKIKSAVQGLLRPISQTVYPYISKKVKENKLEGLNFIRKITIYIGLFSFILSFLLFIFAPEIIHLVAGEKYERSILVLKIIAFLPFIIALSNIFGIQTMLNFNRKKAFSKILISGSILNIILSLIIVPLFQEIGSAISVLVVELFITITMYVYLQKTGINIMKGKLYV